VVAVGILVSVVAIGSTAPASSQTETIPEGDYVGGIYLRIDSATLDLDGLGRLDARLDAAGEATINVAESDSISGIWTLEGSSIVGGTVSQGGVAGTMSANADVTGSGTFSGTALDARLMGTTTATGQSSVTGVAGGGITARFNNTDTWDEPLTNLLVACRQLLARWDSELPAELEARSGPGFQVNSLAAYLVLFNILEFPDESATSLSLQNLATRGNSILTAVRGGGYDSAPLNEGLELLREVEQLQADIANEESDCPSDKAFTNILTLVAQDALDAILLAFEADPDLLPSVSDLRNMVRLGQGTGAIGSGSKDTARATDLGDRMEAQANEQFQNQTDLLSVDDAARDELISLAALGEQQGWSLTNSVGITGEDVLDVAGP